MGLCEGHQKVHQAPNAQAACTNGPHTPSAAHPHPTAPSILAAAPTATTATGTHTTFLRDVTSAALHGPTSIAGQLRPALLPGPSHHPAQPNQPPPREWQIVTPSPNRAPPQPRSWLPPDFLTHAVHTLSPHASCSSSSIGRRCYCTVVPCPCAAPP
eukprot:1142631-Pelagomonas_calceolata.AAC.7